MLMSVSDPTLEIVVPAVVALLAISILFDCTCSCCKSQAGNALAASMRAILGVTFRTRLVADVT